MLLADGYSWYSAVENW